MLDKLALWQRARQPKRTDTQGVRSSGLWVQLAVQQGERGDVRGMRGWGNSG